MLSVVVLLTSHTVPSGSMLFAYFFLHILLSVCLVFRRSQCASWKGHRLPIAQPRLPPSFRATASHKREPNSVTIAQPPLHAHLHTHTHTNLTWRECTWKERQCSVSPSAVKHFEAFHPFHGMMQLVSRTAKHKHSCDYLSSWYAFGSQCFDISQRSLIHTNDFVFSVLVWWY